MEKFEALIEEVVFRNEDNGFTVLQVKIGRERTMAVGTLPMVASGEQVLLSGTWRDHPQYGKQLQISACELIRPSTLTGIERYLASGLVRGIGPATAKVLVQEFGLDTLDILQYAPARLTEVSGIGPKRAEMIAESFREQQEMREAMVFLQSYGITPGLSMRIFKVYGDQAQAVIRENPYRLVEDVTGLGFRTADGIAMSLGFAPESPYRLQAGLHHVLQAASGGDGHCFLPRDQLLQQAMRLLRAPEELLLHALDEQLFAQKLVARTHGGAVAVYLPEHLRAEGETARRLRELLAGAPKGDPKLAEERIARFEAREGIAFSPSQREAAMNAVQHGLSVITGGPGTGKTTIINCILHLLRGEGDVALAAPTGRAAKRMTEATGYEAKTIHRLLEYGGDEGIFQRDQDNPLDAETLIVDEMSMVDIFLMRSLLRALTPGMRLILVGDADQLPSVGPGNVLRDILESGMIPTTQLKDIFRQDEQSMIVVNAHRINNGQMPRLNEKGSDFFLERQPGHEEAAQTLADLCAKRLPEYLKVDPLRHIQVLSPTKKGPCGVWALNGLLQARLNPAGPGKREFRHGETIFRQGDKVMQTRNDYQLEWTRGQEEGEGVFNGDMGMIESVDTEERSLTVRFDDDRQVVYEDSALDDLELAYCISVHKSQGSEFPVVLLPVVGGPPMLLTRNLFYTAVTRARRMVVLVGREDAVRAMVENHTIAMRYSALAERMLGIAP